MAKNDTPTEPIAPPVAPADATAATDTTTASGPMSALVGTPAPAAEDSLVAFLNPDAIPLVLIALLSAVILVRVVNGLLSRLSETMVKHRLLIKQAGTLTAFGIYLLAAVVAGDFVKWIT